MTGHTGQIRSVAISGTGRTVVSGGRDKTVRVWDLASEECGQTLTGHTSMVWEVAVSADGCRAVSCARDGERLLAWDLAGGQKIHRLEGHTGGVPSVVISADGKGAVSGSHDGTARVWDLDTGDCVRGLEGGDAIDAIRLGADGDRALAVDSNSRSSCGMSPPVICSTTSSRAGPGSRTCSSPVTVALRWWPPIGCSRCSTWRAANRGMTCRSVWRRSPRSASARTDGTSSRPVAKLPYGHGS